MKYYLGLILFTLSFSCFAKNTTAMLFLRANVPVSYKVKVSVDQKGVHTKLHTNAIKHHARPKFHIHKNSHSYIVSVVHP